VEHFYLEIRAFHIGAVILSGLLMFVRGLALNMADARWVVAWPIRYLSYTVDTVLLTAALMLMTIVRQYPFADAWITVKLLFVLLYILLGYHALRGKTTGMRWGSLAGAAVTYAFIVSVARSHNALGFFA
jgi:uncharacterized membrane protein SirB2